MTPHPWVGAAKTRLTRARIACVPEIEQQAGERLRVLDLMEMLSDLRDRPANELELFVCGRRRQPMFDALGHEQMHPLPTEARRCPERRELTPLAAGQAAL